MNVQRLKDLTLISSPNEEEVGESYIIYSTELDCFLHCKHCPIHPMDEGYTDGWECLQVTRNAVQLGIYVEQHHMTIEQRNRAKELGFKFLLDFVVEDLGVMPTELYPLKEDEDMPNAFLLKSLVSKKVSKLIISSNTQTIVKAIENHAS